MRNLHDISINAKLVIAIMLCSSLALLVACSLVVVYDRLSFKSRLVDELEALAGVVGANSTAALAFRDPAAAAEVLAALRAEPSIDRAVLSEASGEPFASWSRHPDAPEPETVPALPEGHRYDDGRLVVHRSIGLEGDPLGTLVLSADLDALGAHTRQFALAVTLALLVAVVLTASVSWKIRELIAGPIVHLVTAAKAVTERGDYSIRVPRRWHDELGVLTDAFNNMLGQVELRDRALRAARDHLESRVNERTRMLETSRRAAEAAWERAERTNTELRSEMEQRKKAERERFELERQLYQAHKLEAVGQLAAGIAHEINTPMQFIGDNARFLQEGVRDLAEIHREYSALLAACKQGRPDPQLVARIDKRARESDLEFVVEESHQAIEQSLEGIQRVTDIVRAMKAFSHPANEKTPSDVNAAIRNTLTVARNEWKYVCEVETDLAEDLGPVSLIPGEFNQVLLNLVVNAAQAIGEVVGDGSNGKGRIRVSTRRDGTWAEIRVSDTGSGIPDVIRERIFEPFFTTKEVGKGTGQGLAIAHNVIVHKHAGSIDVESEAGKGSTFVLRLPAVDATEATEPADEVTV